VFNKLLRKEVILSICTFIFFLSVTVNAFAITGNGTQVQPRNGHLEVKEAFFFDPDKSLIIEGQEVTSNINQYNITLRVYDYNKNKWAEAGEKVDIALKSPDGSILFKETFYTNDAGYVYGHVLTNDLPSEFFLDVYIEAKVIKLNGVASEIIESPSFSINLFTNENCDWEQAECQSQMTDYELNSVYVEDEYELIPEEFYNTSNEYSQDLIREDSLHSLQGIAVPLYFIPGVGQVALIATGAVVVGGITYYAGSAVYKKTKAYLVEKAYNDDRIAGRKADSHSTEKQTKSLPTTGKEFSSKDLVKDGKVIQRRYYGKNGKAQMDIDYTNHGNAKKHPKVPHRHDWKNGVRGGQY